MPDRVSEVEQFWVARTTEVPSIDPLFADGCGEPHFFWSDPARELTAAGFGVAVEQVLPRASIGEAWAGLSGVARIEHHGLRAPGPWFGGVAFDPARHDGSGRWAGFPAARWVIPEVLVWTCDSRSFVTTYRPGGSEPVDVIPHPGPLPEGEVRDPAFSPSLREDRSDWDSLIDACLRGISDGGLKKVVAARPIGLSLAARPDVRRLLHSLRRGGPRTTTFLMRSADGERAFVGATPERLCRIEGRRIETEALASSAPPTEHDLLARGDKERREHRAVIDGLEDALAPLCDELNVGREPRLLELSYVSHLQTQLQGTLREGVTAGEVLQAIYPTAAVGGTPRAPALEFIAHHEGWTRGWYAGAIGWAGPDGVDLKVAIRSALVHGREAEVFVGAGIVAGSSAEKEWLETATKARPMLAALGGADGRR